ncbi:MAG TPA: nucleotidyltransferase domain-containing protein [Spirochaetota bacterium]|nr:nucleotidyltransferase domain-containing protein [Spirochaetota bacterium]
MVDESIVIIVKNYLKKLENAGFEKCFAVIFGSQVSGKNDFWSDIDLLIVSPVFDRGITREYVNMLWRIAASTDSRIEPVPVGKIQYDTDDGNAVIEIARRHGKVISTAA